MVPLGSSFFFSWCVYLPWHINLVGGFELEICSCNIPMCQSDFKMLICMLRNVIHRTQDREYDVILYTCMHAYTVELAVWGIRWQIHKSGGRTFFTGLKLVSIGC